MQSLFGERPFDRLSLWVHPVVLGPGKKVFQGGTVPSNLTFVEPARTSPKGVAQLRYELAEGTPSTGDMSVRDE